MALQTPPRALLFDVFGTCVDWRATVTQAFYDQARVALNSATVSLATSVRIRAGDMTISQWEELAQQWRNSYKAFTAKVAADPSIPWKSIDEHHLESLKQIITERKLDGLWDDEELRALSLVWHHLEPWPDTSRGIALLNKLFYTVTLSNGNSSLLSDLTKHAGMEFTHVFSAEHFGSYKPSPKVYSGAIERLGVQPKDCAMVAAHLDDLKAAKAQGMQVIYVERPLEEDWGSDEVESARQWVDLWIEREGSNGFVTLAEKLGVKVDETIPLRRTSSTA
ncbi:HAD-like domain-containing protein [Massariosphaeria phaeospora]|uniref:HAD-like domain-containing protein n=1 Tax=Massariosphaeria phaeospora TaxID=100035 RepID=A0A7C8MEY4_9PLEO|nr:HAD-like domain-containing protein [Massariosphaeria phaeospora]